MLPNSFPKTRLARAFAIALPLAVLADALWVRADPESPPWQGLDAAWNGLVGGSDEGLWWNLAETFNRLGAQPGLGLIAIGLFVLALWRWRSALFAVAVLVLTSLIVDLFKVAGHRPRPDDVMVDIGSWAFPSGHSARMAALVVIVAAVAIPPAYLRWWWPVGALLILTMMWARTWQHAHWLSDTVGGAATGLGVAMLTWWAMTPLLERERAKRESAARRRAADANPSGTAE